MLFPLFTISCFLLFLLYTFNKIFLSGGMKVREIIVVDYDPEWAEEFKRFKEIYSETISELKFDIQHVGSTSVKGLAAKPIIDIDIIVESDNDKPEIIKKLERLGYKHMGDLGIKGREAFKPNDENAPYNTKYENWMEHHLYLIEKNNVNLINHLKLREYLRKNPNAVKAYGNLKKELATRYKHDIDSYIENKTALITSFLQEMGMTREELGSIFEDNKSD